MKARVTVITATSLMLCSAAWSYPEFQTYIEARSGRNVNCAMCHSHADGPEGLKPGQIGSLNPQQMEALGKARAAFAPGEQVDSPILNAFGDHIIQVVGKQEFLQIRQDPAKLAEALGQDSDLDGDGLNDVREYVDGTLPTDPNHGDPWALLAINLKRRWFHILMVGLATALGLWGLNNLLHGFEALSDAKTERKQG